MTIAKDDFEMWQANPVTEAVARALVNMAAKNKQRWIDISWDGEKTDPVILAELKARAQTAEDLSELTFEQLIEELDEAETVKSERHQPD